MCNIIYKYLYNTMADNNKPVDKVKVIQQQLDETTGIMQQNIRDMIDRGEKLTVLEDKAIDLEKNASGFAKSAKTLKRQMFWKNFKIVAIIGGVGLIGIALIILMIWLSYQV